MPTVGVDRFEDRAARHMILALAHTRDELAAMSVIWGGVCDRHPRPRLGFLESGGGWIAPWLDHMDRHFDSQGLNISGLSRVRARRITLKAAARVSFGDGHEDPNVTGNHACSGRTPTVPSRLPIPCARRRHRR
jgi:hypothetical protein